jgi:hypothetical protein
MVVAGPESDGHVLLTPNPDVADSVQRLIRISVNQPYDEMREHLSEMALAIVLARRCWCQRGSMR